MIRASYALKCQGILAHGRAERFGGFVREDAVFAGPAEAVDSEVDRGATQRVFALMTGVLNASKRARP